MRGAQGHKPTGTAPFFNWGSAMSEEKVTPRKFCKAFKHGTYGQILVALGRGGDGQPVKEIRCLTARGVQVVQANVSSPDPMAAVLDWVEEVSLGDVEPTVKRIHDAEALVPEVGRILLSPSFAGVKH